MAQYLTTFDSDTVGALPADVEETGGTGNFLVQSEASATGGAVLAQAPADAATQKLNFTALVADDVVEVIARFRRVAYTGGASLGSEFDFGIDVALPSTVDRVQGDFSQSDKLRIARLQAGGFNQSAVGFPVSLTVGDWYFLRFRRTRTATENIMQFRAWPDDGTPEPSTWLESTEAESYTVFDEGVAGINGYLHGGVEWDYVGIGTGGDAAVLPPSGPSVTTDASAQPGGTVSFTATDFAGPITSATLTDGTNTVALTNITNTSGDDWTAQLTDVGDEISYVLYGEVTVEVSNASESATTTTTLNPPAEWDQISLEADFATDENSFLYNYGGTPAVPDQFAYDPVDPETGSELTLNTNGYWTSTGDGTWTIYGTDATDGFMETFPLISGDPVSGTSSIAKTLSKKPLTARSVKASGITIK